MTDTDTKATKTSYDRMFKRLKEQPDTEIVRRSALSGMIGWVFWGLAGLFLFSSILNVVLSTHDGTGQNFLTAWILMAFSGLFSSVSTAHFSNKSEYELVLSLRKNRQEVIEVLDSPVPGSAQTHGS